MSVASSILSNFKKTSVFSLAEAFDIKLLGFDKSSNNLYISVGGISYEYSPKENIDDMVSVIKNFYRNSSNPAKALSILKNFTTSRKVDKAPSNLSNINSFKDIDKLGLEIESDKVDLIKNKSDSKNKNDNTKDNIDSNKNPESKEEMEK